MYNCSISAPWKVSFLYSKRSRGGKKRVPRISWIDCAMWHSRLLWRRGWEMKIVLGTGFRRAATFIYDNSNKLSSTARFLTAPKLCHRQNSNRRPKWNRETCTTWNSLKTSVFAHSAERQLERFVSVISQRFSRKCVAQLSKNISASKCLHGKSILSRW